MAEAATDKGTYWIFRLIGAALLIALGYVIVRTVITFTNPESVWTSPQIAPTASSGAAPAGPQNFAFTTDPFNRTVTEIVDVPLDEGVDAPETTLQLTLTGRTTGPDGSAILRTPDNKEATYRIDDEIISGVTLQAVNKDFIVLNVDGQIQRLTFDRGAETGLTIKTADTETTNTKVSVKRAASNSAPQDRLASPAISADVSTLFQSLSLRREMKNGQLTGYSVKPNRPGVDLSRFGFAKGDIVTAIGGTDITRGRPDFLALFEQASQGGGTEVTVLRNGQTRTIKLGTP